MSSAGATRVVSEAVGVFDHVEQMEAAIDELCSSGFDRAELSLVAGEHAVEEKLGHRYEKVQELEDTPGVPREAYVSKESIGAAEGSLIGGLMYVGACVAGAVLASVGAPIAVIIIAAAVAAGEGALIGSVLANVVDEQYARHIQEKLDHGGLLLWVRTRDEANQAKALDILTKHTAHDVHIHEYEVPGA